MPTGSDTTRSIGPWEIGRVHGADSLEAIRLLPDSCLDGLVTDPPYGTTQNKWDRPVPWPEFMRESWRVLRPGRPIVALVDFRTACAMHAAATDEFRYEIVCPHNQPTGHLNAAIRPMLAHLFLVVFCGAPPPWYPQMEDGPRTHGRRAAGAVRITTYGKHATTFEDGSGMKWPTTVHPFEQVHPSVREHASEKPVPLAEWILRSYTEPDAVVCDPFAGSGWVACAAIRTGRRSIGFDSDPESVSLANRRIASEHERLGYVRAEEAAPSQQIGLLRSEGGANR